MFSRRFVLLAGVLVTLNLALWFAGSGLAIRQAIVNQLFGPKLIRAQVHDKNGDWNLDRGVITSVSSTQLTLREADGRVQPITISSSTKVFRFGRRLSQTVLAPRWRVLVMWPLIGPAQRVDVERIPRGRGKGQGQG